MNKLSLNVLAVLVTLVTSSAAWSCDANFYPIFCRGKLAMQMDSVWTAHGGPAQSATEMTITIAFSKFPQSGGSQGVKLSSGTCAWVDRPISATEPGTLQTFIHPGDASAIAFQTITRCLPDSSCVFGGCAQTQGSVIMMYPWNISTHNQ